jgi:hypothetical protein
MIYPDKSILTEKTKAKSPKFKHTIGESWSSIDKSSRAGTVGIKSFRQPVK